LEETADCRKDVLKWTAVQADLQHTSVATVFKGVVVAERQDGVFEFVDSDGRRVEALIAGCIRIVNPGSVWDRVGWGRRQSRIRGLPEYSIRANPIVRCPTCGQCRRCYRIKVLKYLARNGRRRRAGCCRRTRCRAGSLHGLGRGRGLHVFDGAVIKISA
jgi:hypothetical protein